MAYLKAIGATEVLKDQGSFKVGCGGVGVNELPPHCPSLLSHRPS